MKLPLIPASIVACILLATAWICSADVVALYDQARYSSSKN